MTSKQNKRLVLLFLFFLLHSIEMSWASANQAGEINAKDRKTRVPLKLRTTIKARSELVWSSIHEARTDYPGLESGRVISEDKQGSVFEQKFAVPFLGRAECTFNCIDSSPSRMDYKLIKSNIFKAMDGSWTLAPGSNEHSTKVELSCYVAGEMLLPKFLLKLTLGRKLAKQLDFVKTLAERKEVEMEATENPPRADK